MRSNEEFEDDLDKLSKELFGYELYESDKIEWRDLEKLATELKERDLELLKWFIKSAPRHGHGYSIRYFLTKKPKDEMKVPVNVIMGKNRYDSMYKCSCCGQIIDGHQDKIGKKEGIYLRLNLMGKLAEEFPHGDVQISICKECLDDIGMPSFFEGEVDLGDCKYSPLGLR